MEKWTENPSIGGEPSVKDILYPVLILNWKIYGSQRGMRSYQGEWRERISPRTIPALNCKDSVSEGKAFSCVFKSPDCSSKWGVL
jgi:hypothetical protein